MGKGGGGGTPAKQTQISKAIPFLEKDVTYAGEQVRNFYDDPSNIAQYFPGQTYAGFAPETEQALEGITSLALGSPLVNQAADLTSRTLAGDFLRGSPELENVINATTGDITNRFLEEIVPSINTSFAGSGNVNNPLRGLAFGDASGQVAREIGNVAGNLRLQNLQAERGYQQQALGMAPTIQQLQFQPYEALAGVGDARRALDQARIDEEMDRFRFEQQAEAQSLDDFLNRIALLSGVSGTGTSSTSTSRGGSSGGSSGGLAGALSGGLAGLSLAGSLGSSFMLPAAAPTVLGGAGALLGLLSDERVKENIVPIGKENGHNVYEFNYKGSKDKYIGVMAQEVQKTNPEAVHEHDGYLRVDYDKIGVNFRHG